MVSSRLNTVVCSTQPTKFLPTNSHLPSAHQCPTRLKNTVCTLSDIIFSQLFETVRIRSTHSSSYTTPDSGHVCVNNLVPRTLELSTVKPPQPMRKMGSRGKSLFLFSFFLLPFVNVQRNMTASNSVFHKLTICL